MSTEFAYDVFLSHNSKDKPRVRRLAERLKKAGLRVWFDEWNIAHKDIIALKVEEGLEKSRVQLLCLSPNALASGWSELERNTVIHRDPVNIGRRFVPLLLADCDLPDTLRRYKYIDLRVSAEAAFLEVIAACKVTPTEAPRAVTLHGKKRPKKNAKEEPARPRQAEPLAVLERKLTGHEGWVKSVVVSPDGVWLASGSDDQRVKIWNLETGECQRTLKGHEDRIYSIGVTSDGKRILSGSTDHSIRVWDAATGRKLGTLAGHTNEVWSLALFQDNSHALSGGWDGALKLWHLASRSCIQTIEAGSDSDDRIYSIALTRAGTHALSGHQDGRVRWWSLETGKCLATLKGHRDTVQSLQIMPDGRFAVSGSSDATVKVWDLEARSCVGTLEGHQCTVDSVAISPDGSLIASAGFMDDTVRLWDWKSGVCLQVIGRKEITSPLSVTFSLDGLRLVVGTANAALIYVYRLTGVRSTAPSEATRRYVNAKVVLLGEGTVGKTSLAHRLTEDKYVVRDRTHGMNVSRLELPLSPDTSFECDALLWDLAGQEDYRLIHRLFLEQTALALLLVNPQKHDPFSEAGDWLKALKTAAGPASPQETARLLIFSQVDVGEPKLGRAKIEQFCRTHGFADWLLTSAKNGRNCSDKKNNGQPSKLKQLIADCVPWDRLPWTSTPRLLAELKNAVVAMRDQRDIRLLRFAELIQRLEQALPGEKFGQTDVRTAVTLLANHGMVRPLKFGDLVLLEPELLNGYAGAIIRAARAHTDEIGCVSEGDIYQPDFDFTGVERLKHRPDEELLLRALVQTFLDHSLCITEDTPEGRHLVFPSQYRREKNIPRDPDFFVSYTFSGEWQTVWTTLVVRLWYSQEFGHKELWRNAAEFVSPKGFTLGLKIANQSGEGTATVSLYFDTEVEDVLKAIFIEYVHRHLAKYACEVTRDRRYVCSHCGKPVRDIEVVRDRMEAGMDFIRCQKCDAKVPLIDYIEQRLKSDPVARKILVMDEIATRELDTQALEQILIGHMMAIAGEANQIFRPVTMFDHGIDGEVEFKDNGGKASGKRIYVQLKSGNSYIRMRQADGTEIFDVKDDRHLDYWINQPVDVYLVIRKADEARGGQTIRWMNVTRYLKEREGKRCRQIVFAGEKLDFEAVYRVRDRFFPNVVHK